MRPVELGAILVAALLAAPLVLWSVARVERAPEDVASEPAASFATDPSPRSAPEAVELDDVREPALVADAPPAPQTEELAAQSSTDAVVLAGRVIDSAGRPVSGVELHQLRPGAQALRGVRVATTDEQGAFRIEGLPMGPWSLRITSADHPDRFEKGTTDEPGTIVDGLEFVLADGAELRGRVVGAPDDVLESLWVRAAPAGRSVGRGEEPPMPQAPRWARCVPDGAFVVRGLEPAAVVTVDGRDDENESYQRPLTTVVEARAGSEGIELVYRPPTVVVAEVVDARTLAPVTMFEARIGERHLAPVLGSDGRAQHDFPGGRLRCANVLPVAPQQLAIDAYGYAELQLEVHPLEGRELDLGVLRLEPAPMVAVRVVDASTGKPVPGARVTLSGAGIVGKKPAGPETPWRTFSTDADGRARLNGLPGKAAVLRVLHPDYAPFESSPLRLPESGDVHEDVLLQQRKR